MGSNDVNDTGSSTARNVERVYQSPEIAQQRFRTLQALGIRPGEAVLDAGCGPGLLTAELARLAGDQGRVLAVDKNPDMLALARERCAGLPWVELRQASIERLEDPDASFDAVSCTQVLLYLNDVPAVLAEMHRAMRPGARLAIVETDWRGCVLSGDDPAITETMIRAWDDAVPSPNLPVRLPAMLCAAGFEAIRVEPIPILDTSLPSSGYSSDMIRWLSRNAVAQGAVDESRARAWLDDLHRQAERGEYFFCVNRFLFSAVK